MSVARRIVGVRRGRLAKCGPIGPVQVVHVQHPSHIPRQPDAGPGGRSGQTAHRPRSTVRRAPPVAGGRDGLRHGRRADGRRIYAVLRSVFRSVLQQPRLRRANSGDRPVLLRVS